MSNPAKPPPGMYLSLGGQVIIVGSGPAKNHIAAAWEIIRRARAEGASSERERLAQMAEKDGVTPGDDLVFDAITDKHGALDTDRLADWIRAQAPLSWGGEKEQP